VTYADLYRQTKIEETVYELLTQQYELAKVQEAKEIPAVKVLDAAVVPTKKSFPPRLLIVFLRSGFGHGHGRGLGLWGGVVAERGCRRSPKSFCCGSLHDGDGTVHWFSRRRSGALPGSKSGLELETQE